MKHEEKYTQFSLVQEMLDTPAVLKDFSLDNAGEVIAAIQKAGKLFMTGEGSSRIFPAKNAIYTAMCQGTSLNLATDGGRQAAEYDLSDYVVFGASNSGSTKEVITLFNQLKGRHNHLYGLTARENTKLAEMARETFVLKCGWEQAVAATKSVAEQGLFYQELLAQANGNTLKDQLGGLTDAVEDALTLDIDSEITQAIANAGMIHFAGRNDGVAEELTLKTNEITRKKSDYLEGTYAVHGIEEVMESDDVVILIDPFEGELDKIRETLAEGIGTKVYAISDQETIFPTIKVKDAGPLKNYVYLAAGWNILVEVGIVLGINLDKAERARKIGNEFVG